MSVSFDFIDPSNLSDRQLTEICSIEADMWAREEGLGTYMYCKQCDTTHSKQKIYLGKIDTSLYKKTVFEIEDHTKRSLLHCTECQNELFPIFNYADYLEVIRERYSSWAMLLLMSDESWIVGFMDGHISDYDTIFRRDLSYRYPQERKQEIASAIRDILDWEVPESMFSCSSMGTSETYMNFNFIYGLLQNFFWNFPKEHEDKVWISELNAGWSLDKIYTQLGSENIWISSWNQHYRTQSYSSWLFIQRNLWKIYKQAFSVSLRDFLRNRKNHTQD